MKLLAKAYHAKPYQVLMRRGNDQVDKKISVDELVDKLKQDFEEKSARKSSYSRRALAQYLGINPSTLQKVLKGERQLGILIAEKIALKLGYTLKKPEKKRRARAPEIISVRSPSLLWLILILRHFNLPAVEMELILTRSLKIPKEMLNEALSDLSKVPMKKDQDLAEFEAWLLKSLRAYLKDLGAS